MLRASKLKAKDSSDKRATEKGMQFVLLALHFLVLASYHLAS